MDIRKKMIQKYSMRPEIEFYSEIKNCLLEEIKNHNNSVGCGDYLRLLCYFVFFFGNVEDSTLIWKAKNLNMDTKCMIDTPLLCGGGYEETLNYLSQFEQFFNIKEYIEEFYLYEDDFDKNIVIDSFISYYN